ncbi:MAG: hypothetical protein WC547_08950, partial [Candidatus Omnitrophota bacterium]
MVDLVLRFRTPVNLLIFVLVAVISGCWAYHRMVRKVHVSVVPVIAGNLILLAGWTLLKGLDHDGVGHLHAAWLISQGMVPYRDFWMHQPPALWLLLSPILKIFPPSPAIFDFGRALSSAVFVINGIIGWKVARKVWKEKASVSMYLLALLGCATTGEFTLLRPDIFMVFFMLIGMFFCLDASGKRALPCFCAGAAFSLAASFMPKQYLLYPVPLIAIFMGLKEGRIRKIAAYCAGFFAGSLPLLLYLINFNILSDFFYWVFRFNRMIINVTIYFPLIIAFMGWWGGWLLFMRFRRDASPQPLIFFIVLSVSTLTSLVSTTVMNGGHYLSLWFFICSIAFAGCDIPAVLNKARSLSIRAVFVGLFFSLLVAPNLVHVLALNERNYFSARIIAGKIMKYSAGDTCVLIIPMHPVFAHDATSLYSDWEFFYSDRFLSLKKVISHPGVAGQILAKRPAMVLCRYQRKDFMLALFDKGLISADDYKRLIAFFKENYTRKRIGRDSYYI